MPPQRLDETTGRPIPRRIDGPGVPTGRPRRIDTAPEDDDSSWLESLGVYGGMGIRGLSGLVGNAGGFVGAAAAGGGDLLAQALERATGVRDQFSTLEAGAAAGLGAIPFGKAASWVTSLGRGAMLGGAGGAATETARQLEDDQEGVDLDAILRTGVIGGVIGGGAGLAGHGVASAVGRRNANRPQPPRPYRSTAEEMMERQASTVRPDVPPPSGPGGRVPMMGEPGRFTDPDDPLRDILTGPDAFLDPSIPASGMSMRPDKAGTGAANRSANRIAEGMQDQRRSTEPRGDGVLGPILGAPVERGGRTPLGGPTGAVGAGRLGLAAPGPDLAPAAVSEAGTGQLRRVAGGGPNEFELTDDVPFGPFNQGQLPLEPTAGMAGLSRSRGVAPEPPNDLVGTLDDDLLPLGPFRQGGPLQEPTAGLAGLSRSGGNGGIFRPDDAPTTLQFGQGVSEPTTGMAGLSRSRGDAPPSPWQTPGADGPLDLDVRGGTPEDDVDALMRSLGVTDDVLEAATSPRTVAASATPDGIRYVPRPGTISAELPDGTVVGSLNFVDNGADGLKLANIDVDENMRRQGIGTQLLETLRKQAGDRPIDRGDAVTPEGQAFRAATSRSAADVPAEPLIYIPREQEQAYREIIEREARAAMTGQEQPGLDTLIGAARRWQEEPNPRRLWGVERKATQAARSRVGRWMRQPGEGGQRQPTAPSLQPSPLDPTPAPPLEADSLPPDAKNRWLDALFGDDSGAGGEAGYIDPTLLEKLGRHAGGAAIGSAVGGYYSDDDTRARNMIGGAILGGALPAGGQRLAKLRYASMLGGSSPQLSNISGGVSATLVRATEEALTGNVQGAKDLLSGVFDQRTLDAIVDSWKRNPGAMDGDVSRWGSTSGILGAPSRAMHAVDEGITSGMTRGGLSTEEAKLQLLTSKPRSRTGQWVASRPGEGWGSAVMPFVRTATNLVERGLEHTPGAGFLKGVKAMRPNDSTGRRLARQGMGLAAMGAGAAFGDEHPQVTPLLGPLALPYALGTAGVEALESRSGGDPLRRVTLSAFDTLRRMAPLPSNEYAYDPTRYLASYVPGIVRDANWIAPDEFRQDQSIFDPAIARIPVVNEAVLPRRVKRPRRVSR
jgi:GNAT superfamily N-acetyltransferase